MRQVGLASIESDRKDLLSCITKENSQSRLGKNSSVITRLIKGQNPTSSAAQTVSLDLKDVTSLRKTVWQEDAERPNNTFLFHLNTLYAAQERVWRKYDQEWALFDQDHVKNKAPIPSSAQFLLVHLIGQLKSVGQFRRLTYNFGTARPSLDSGESNPTGPAS